MWRGVLAGLGVGLLAGWLIWGRPATGPDAGTLRPDRTPAARHESRPTLVGGVAGARERVIGSKGQAAEAPQDPAGGMEGESAQTAPPPDRSQVFLSEPIIRVREVAQAHSALTDREVVALITRMEEARRKKRRYDFLMLVRTLGASRHPLAHAQLVELLGDVASSVPDGFIELATEFLSEIRTPGLVEAALRRAQLEKEPGPWIELVVERGTPEQWEELLTSESRRFHPSLVFTFLMRRKLETARSYLQRSQAEPWPGGNRFDVVRAFVLNHPTQGYALLAEGFAAFDEGADEWYGANGVHMLITLVLAAAGRDPAALPLFAAELNGLKSRQDRLSACWGLQYAAGNDFRPVQPLIDQLGLDLREVVDNPGVISRPGERIRFIAEAMEEVEALQTAANIAALEHAVTHWDGSETKQLRDILKRLKAPPGDEWR